MVLLIQLPAGKECKVLRKIVWLLMWFIVSELIRDNQFVTATTEIHQPLQNASNNIHDFLKNSAALNKNPKATPIGNYVDSQPEFNRKLRAVPPRVKVPNKDSSSWDALNDEFLRYIRKIPINAVEFQRIKLPRSDVSDNTEKGVEHLELFDHRKRNDEVKQNTLLPMPLFGRSINKDVNNLDTESSVDKHIFSERSNTIIPIARPERNSNKIKRDTSSVLPYPRLGRFSTIYGDEDFLVGKVKKYLSDNDQKFVYTDFKDLDFNNLVQNMEEHDESNKIGPFEQVGDTDAGDIFHSQIKRQNNSGYVIPQIRYGRSILLLATTKNDKSAKEKPQIFVLPYHRPVRSNEVNNVQFKYSKVLLPYPISENSKDLHDSGSFFVIPYPSPVNKSSKMIEYSKKGTKTNIANNKKINDYVVPYPRPGKKFYNEHSVKKFKNINNENESYENQILLFPYSRPDRSYHDWTENKNTQVKHHEIQNIDNETLMDQYKEAGEQQVDGNTSTVYVKDISKLEDVSSGFMFKRSNTILPYPRPGRSNFVVPYPRPGRSNTAVLYPRPGRANTVLPYPRPGRSNSVIAYSRLGRSNYIIPYPRSGRSTSVTLYPKVGRSNYVIAYPRLGKSKTVVLHLRHGIPYSRLGRYVSAISYPSSGRSNLYNTADAVDGSYSIAPIASNYNFPNIRLRKSNYIIPYPRPGHYEDQFVSPKINQGREFSKRENTYIIPYPRPGRVIEKKGSKNNMILPYPRPGRSNGKYSGYVIPYPRVGRSEYADFNENKTPIDERVYSKRENAYIIPYPRPGRFIEKKGSENNMVLQYPRPSRSNLKYSGYVIPYPRVGRSEYADFNENKTPIDGRGYSKRENTYIIPYPRPGRFIQKKDHKIIWFYIP